MSILKGLNQYGNSLNSFGKSFFDILKKREVKFVIPVLLSRMIDIVAWREL